ncbi:MAG: hypothetical protein CSA20_03890 [Deltaproteobacteria bacterium]|nr:MAG: hypothetical protein CSA20_03890 [Deltaproteobacteria bacterium]
MNKLQNPENIIDLEYFLHQDLQESTERLHARDRQIAMQLASNSPESELPDDFSLLDGWLQARRSREFSDPALKSPGGLFAEARKLTTTLICCKGLLVGLFAGWAFFAYAGVTPINVLQFLLFFVATQIFVLFLLLLTSCWKIVQRGRLPQAYFLLFRRLGGWIFRSLNKAWLRQLGEDRRLSLRHAYGLISGTNKSYGSLLYWPFFSLLQLFAISFNLGLLSASMIKIITSDLAFGWQSTVQFGADAIFTMVQWLSLPWSWLLPPGTAAPTYSEIEGSRIILKDGILHLTTDNLVAWWPFLICCILCYGLLSRLVLYAVGRIMERIRLKGIRFQTPAARALLRRMKTPLLSTSAEDGPEENISQASLQTRQPAPKTFAAENLYCTVLIPDELFAECPQTERAALLEQLGYREEKSLPFMRDYDEDQQLLHNLSKQPWDNQQTLCIIMEGWMVPLISFVVFLEDLRKKTSPETIIEIILTGRKGDQFFTKVEQKDLQIWQKKIGALGDPFIHITPAKGVLQ